MFRALLRLVVVVVVLVAAAAFFLGWWGSDRLHPGKPASTIGTAGHVDTTKAREVGADVGQKTAAAANRVEAALSDGSLTAKIKSKMALDDTVRARTVDVSTTDHVVTVSGSVRSAAERDRVLQLARETAGVTRVIDHITVAR
jgi:hyperosmotically inducible periplasmic protein